MRARLALFSLLFALPVVVLAILQARGDFHRARDTAQTAVNGAADALARRLAQDLAGAEALANALGAIDLGRPDAAAACSLALQRATAASGTRISNYIIVAPDGQVLCSGQPLRNPVNVSDRPHVQQALQTGRPALSGFTVGRVSGRGNVQLVVPILDADGRRVKALAVTGLAAATLSSGLLTQGDLALTHSVFDRNGILVSRNRPSPLIAPGQTAAASDLFRQRDALTIAAMEVKGLDGVLRLSASRPVRLHGETVLWVTSGVDMRTLQAEFLAALLRDAGIALLLAIALAGAAYLTSRRLLLQRSRGLSTVAADVAVGNYRSRVPVTVHDDITPVETALNAMLDAVESDRIDLAKANHALRESDSEFRALAESMPQIVWMTLPDGRNIYFNQRWADYTGLSLAESHGHGWNKPFHPDDQQRAWDAWQLATTTIGTYRTECRLRRADGTYRWWLLRGEPVRDAGGAVVKWVGTCTDIDDMKLAALEVSRVNAELKQQQVELRVLFDLMPAWILFKDTEGRILRVNRFGALAAGRPVEDIEGKLALEVFPELAPVGNQADREVMRSGKPQLGVINKVLDRHGNDMWIQHDRVPYQDVDGNVIGIVVMVQDITERKQAQDALRELNAELEERVRRRTAELSVARNEAEQASHAKSDFLAAMSHEIRTPMSGVLGLIELLGLSPLDEEQQAKLALARDSGIALMHIIDDILDFSKIEANRLELVPVAASVKEVVEKVCRLHLQLASRKNLVLHADVATQISPLLSFDPVRLGQILNNFLSNAIKFTERGSVEVLVDLVARGEGHEELRFRVRDTGIGMTPEQLGRLFQPFTQATAEIGASFGGTGLGLVISRRLAEMMGGTVDIQSEQGKGTTLTLSLQLAVCDATSREQSRAARDRQTLAALMAGRRTAPSVPQAEADGTLLLVVDDHPTNRMLLLRQLASLGYAAEAAADGVEAFAAWESGRFAALITDCNMPRMNGYDLAAAIRDGEQRSGLPRAPIIACTANALQSARDLCMAAGMDDCLVKPADLARVGELLDRWVPLAHDGVAGRRPAPPAAAHPRAAPLQAQGLLDIDLLAEISGGDAVAQGQILADFRRVNELDASSLRQAAGSDSFAQVAEFSHRIKGASLMLGATLLSESCARVETAAAVNDPAHVAIAMGDFETELLRLNDFLDAL